MYKLLFLLCAVTLATVQASRITNFNRYYYYKRPDATSAVELSPQVASLNFVKKSKSVILIHGHGENYESSLNPAVKKSLLDAEDINVFTIDWSVYAGQSYDSADKNVPNVGSEINDFLNLLLRSDIAAEEMHLVGFGLGGYIASYAGKQIPNIARLTVLNPTKTNYYHEISRGDANYVEVIHTDIIDGNDTQASGIGKKMGHADFYPNGGGQQPGCYGSHSCSRTRAWELFAASMDAGKTFSGHCCTDILDPQEQYVENCKGVTLHMGGNDLWKENICPTGIYYVETGDAYPF